MNEQDDFDRTLRAWFEGDAVHTAPHDLLESVVLETRGRRPWRGWLARLAADGVADPVGSAGVLGRPLVILAILAALLVGLLGGAILAGRAPRPLVVVNPTPTATTTPVPTASPYVFAEPALTVSGGSLPTLEIPPGFTPRMTPGGLEQHVLEVIIKDNEQDVGRAIAPARVTAIRLLPPGTSYPTTWADGLDHGGPTFRSATLSWAVDAEGTLIACGSTCSMFASGTVFFDDATEANLGTGARGTTTAVPSASFRDWLSGFGQAFTPSAPPAKGVVGSASILKGLIASGTIPKGTRTDPIYGLVTCVDATLGCATGGIAQPGQTVAIWWIGFPDIPAPPRYTQAGALPGTDNGPAWDTFDARTGAEMNGSGP